MNISNIGRYQIRGEIGRGGMATVYRAFDPQFERDVAVKVLPREFLSDPAFLARFKREAKVIASLEHPAIVPVYDFGEEDGQPFLVMRYMSGGSLASRMLGGPMNLSEAARIMSRVAPAIDEAHLQGIIHRDLKPDNILFDQHQLPYISDFGIAKLTESTASLTGSGIVGTPAYMSPEQARGDKNVDGRSDVYTLGSILFEILTGQFPYRADTPVGVVMKHITEPVPRILEARPDLPEACQSIIDRAMAKEPARRFASAVDFANALDAVARGKVAPIAAPPPTSLDIPSARTFVDTPSGDATVRAVSAPPPPVVRTPTPPTPVVAPPPDPSPPRSGGIPMWVWIVAGIAVLAFGVLVGLLIVVGPTALPLLLGSGGSPAPIATASTAPPTAPVSLDVSATAAPTGDAGLSLTATAASCAYSFAFTGIEPTAGTEFPAGEPFTVAVLINNTGTCAFPDGTMFALEKGDQLNASPILSVPSVQPAQSGRIEISMAAPTDTDTASQVWAFRLPDGSVMGDSVVLTYNFALKATATPTPTATNTAGPRLPTATATSAPTATAASSGPLAYRRTDFVSATRTTGNEANVTLSVVFTGGASPYTISGDGMGAPTTKGITGTFTDAGVTYNFIHFQRVSSCGASLPGTVNLRDAAGQAVSGTYFVTVNCP